MSLFHPRRRIQRRWRSWFRCGPRNNNIARIFKRLWGPEIDSKERIPPAYVAWRAGMIPCSCSVPSLRASIDSRK